MTLVHNLAGWQGLHVLMAVLFACTAAYITRYILAYLEPVHVVIIMALSVAMMHTHLLVRPHVLAWPILAIWFGTLAERVESGRTPPLWLLPLLLLWTNMHASFTLGLAFLAAFAFDALLRADRQDRIRTAIGWGAFGVAAGLVAMINPRGWHAYTHAVDLMGMSVTLSYVSEWRSTNFHHPQLLMLWLLLVFLLALVGKLRLSLWRGVMLFFMLYLALKHNRYHSLLALTTPFLIVPALKGLFSENPPESSKREASSAPSAIDRVFLSLAPKARPLIVVVFLALATAGTAALSDRWRLEPAKSLTPQAALDSAYRLGLDGPVFNAYGFGGYLIFRGEPVFVDGRADLYGDPFIAKLASALAITEAGELEELLDEHKIKWTLLQPNIPATRVLDLLPEWERVYADSVAVIHRRRLGPEQLSVSIQAPDSVQLTRRTHEISRLEPRPRAMLPLVERMLSHQSGQLVASAYARATRDQLHIEDPARRKRRRYHSRQQLAAAKQLGAAL